MLRNILRFYSPSNYQEARPPVNENKKILNRLRWSVFTAATLGYGLYYVCRLSLNVIKKPLISEGLLTESQLGIIGSALFFSYAIGKLINGFIADRSNIRKFMATGLFVSAVINLLLGFTSTFFFFVILWGINGWFQSMGATPAIISITRWFSNKERGTYYGYFSASHNIGEAATFIFVALLVSSLGWRFGFWGAAITGLAGAVVIALFMYERPEVKGFTGPDSNSNRQAGSNNSTIGNSQLTVLKNPYIWILALSSACMYVSRYAINSWGILFLETQKGYSTIQASSVISVGAISGIAGNIFSGLISDRFFNSRRNVPALIFGMLNTLSLILFLYTPQGHLWVDIASMALFGIAIGVLISYLGGLMAVDISSKQAAGTAVGVVGIASYLGAGIQDIISGQLIENSKVFINGISHYTFKQISYLWVGASIISFLLALLLWNVKSED